MGRVGSGLREPTCKLAARWPAGPRAHRPRPDDADRRSNGRCPTPWSSDKQRSQAQRSAAPKASAPLVGPLACSFDALPRQPAGSRQRNSVAKAHTVSLLGQATKADRFSIGLNPSAWRAPADRRRYLPALVLFPASAGLGLLERLAIRRSPFLPTLQLTDAS